MSGNVLEWTRSLYGKYPYQPGSKRENFENKSDYRVLRGGSFLYGFGDARCAYRGDFHPGGLFDGMGFRVVFSPFISDL